MANSTSPLSAPIYGYRDIPGAAGSVVSFSAEALHDAGLSDVLNYDAENKPYSIKDHALMAYMLEVIKTQNARIVALENAQ